MEEGSETALKDYYKKCQDQLDELVKLTVGDLSKGDRKKVITLCTIDTHARDVVQKLIDEKVETATAFQWQSQLRLDPALNQFVERLADYLVDSFVYRTWVKKEVAVGSTLR